MGATDMAVKVTAAVTGEVAVRAGVGPHARVGQHVALLIRLAHKHPPANTAQEAHLEEKTRLSLRELFTQLVFKCESLCWGALRAREGHRAACDKQQQGRRRTRPSSQRPPVADAQLALGKSGGAWPGGA